MSTKAELKHGLRIFIGSMLMAVAIAFFLLPAEIVTGGTPGMGILLHILTPLTVGQAMLAINIPLLLAGWAFIDLGFALRSIFSMILTAVAVDYLPYFISFPEINSLLLSTLYGGIIAGVGVGLVLQGRASAGGTTIVARILSQYSHFKPAQIVLVMDSMILLAVGLIFQDLEKVLWSMISIYITARLIDRMLTGAVSEKFIHIVSKHNHTIGQTIKEELGRDGTILEGHNLTMENDKSILFVVVGIRRIPQLRDLVLSIDPNALMVVVEAAELSGTSRIRKQQQIAKKEA
ncbi:YitT family protein [Marinicella rhabdoformis]|uniref:YitT family protein n=1 Tax=Marinicella rhabdoformis TaxID=2580566 RepID=UPI0012AECC9A|nr:YitT family protein [Marinicella rhabdoformis]